MHRRFLAVPIAATVLGVALSIALAATSLSTGAVGAGILICALIGVGITVWSVLTDKTRSQHWARSGASRTAALGCL
jgi:hypothetical protein